MEEKEVMGDLVKVLLAIIFVVMTEIVVKELKKWWRNER